MDRIDLDTKNDDRKKVLAGLIGLSAIGAGAFMYCRYHVGLPHQFLAKTGLGIKNIDVSKNTMQWPLQHVTRVSMEPRTIRFEQPCMSAGMIQFKIPFNIVYAPYDPIVDSEGFINYCTRMENMTPEATDDLVGRQCAGHIRILTAQMDIDEIFSGRDELREKVTNRIREDLRIHGIDLQDINVQELDDIHDDPDNVYFKHRRQRAVQSAVQKMHVDVAEAEKTGKIGVAEQNKFEKSEVSTQNAEALIIQNEQRQ